MINVAPTKRASAQPKVAKLPVNGRRDVPRLGWAQCVTSLLAVFSGMPDAAAAGSPQLNALTKPQGNRHRRQLEHREPAVDWISAGQKTPSCDNLGLRGECKQVDWCLCLCFDVSQGKTQVEAAYFGELGYELLLMAPYLNEFARYDMLRKTIGPPGSTPFYFFSPDHCEALTSRHFCLGPSAHPTIHTDTFSLQNWRPPAYKTHYANDLLRFEKPLLIIHNKYAHEWGHEPRNFIDVSTLSSLAAMLKPNYTVVYMRPTGHEAGFNQDDNQPVAFDDHGPLKAAHPEVLMGSDLWRAYEHSFDFNVFQLKLHANCDNYISVQGGNSILASYFANKNIIFAVEGGEVRHPNEYREVYPRLNANVERSAIIHVESYPDLLKTAQAAFVDA